MLTNSNSSTSRPRKPRRDLCGRGCGPRQWWNVDESAVNFAEYFRKYGVPETGMMTRCALFRSLTAAAAATKEVADP